MVVQEIKKKHALVVEDSEDLGVLLSYMLEKLGMSVSVVSNGTKALQSALVQSPDLVLLDYSLPDMTGSEVARHLCESLPHMPLIITLTGYAKEEIQDEMSQSGIYRILQKPVSSSTLSSIVTSLYE